MPRDLDPTLITELTRLDSDHALTWLFAITIPGAPVTLTYAVYDQDITFHGLAYTAIQAQVERLEDATSATMTTLRVTWENITQEFVSLAENYWITVANPAWEVIAWQLDAQQPDLVPYEAGEVFLVNNMVSDLFMAVADLTPEGVSLGMVLPKRRYSRASGFSGIPQRV